MSDEYYTLHKRSTLGIVNVNAKKIINQCIVKIIIVLFRRVLTATPELQRKSIVKSLLSMCEHVHMCT